jgi:hypothetical protein
MVVTSRPAAALAGKEHDRTGLSSKWTVQAPQKARPHPNLVPVRPAMSRIAHDRGMSGSNPSKTRSCPFKVSFIARSLPCRRRGRNPDPIEHGDVFPGRAKMLPLPRRFQLPEGSKF